MGGWVARSPLPSLFPEKKDPCGDSEVLVHPLPTTYLAPGFPLMHPLWAVSGGAYPHPHAGSPGLLTSFSGPCTYDGLLRTWHILYHIPACPTLS